MKSVGEQLAELLGVGQFVRGAWFLLPNEQLIRNHRRWSLKEGRHPVILVVTGGPNATVLPRSSTIESGLPHDAHSDRHEMNCRITKPGYIKIHSPMRVDARVLINESFSCYEPETTGILEKLGIGI